MQENDKSYIEKPLTLRQAFINSFKACEAAAFDYAHSLPEGVEREQATLVYHRIRLAGSNGKGGMQSRLLVDTAGAQADAQRAVNLEQEPELALSETAAPENIDLDAADFSDALMWLKEGKRVQRAGWNGAGQWVEAADVTGLFFPSHHADTSMPISLNLVLKNAQGAYESVWTPSTGDLLANDWKVFNGTDVETDAESEEKPAQGSNDEGYSKEYPKYYRGNLITGFNIGQLNYAPDGKCVISPVDPALASLTMPQEWCEQYKPRIGMYMVINRREDSEFDDGSCWHWRTHSADDFERQYARYPS